MLYNLIRDYKQGHYHSQIFHPLLLYCDPKLLDLLLPALAMGAPQVVASCVWPYIILTHSGVQILTDIVERMKPLAGPRKAPPFLLTQSFLPNGGRFEGVYTHFSSQYSSQVSKPAQGLSMS